MAEQGDYDPAAQLVTGFLRHYPQYTLNDIFNKRFKDGGLTKGQIIILFTHASKDVYNVLRTQAVFNSMAVWGKDPAEVIETKTENKVTKIESSSTQPHIFPVFESLDKYAAMSPEERAELTDKMMSKHKRWAEQDAAPKGFGKD